MAWGEELKSNGNNAYSSPKLTPCPKVLLVGKGLVFPLVC